MDFDEPSSPAALRSSLPPSSAPNPTQTTNGRSPRRPAADALTFGDDEADEDNGDEDAKSRKRKRAKGQVNADVPLVKDAVGESVRESFETFMRTCVHYAFFFFHLDVAES
jgi:DNA replication licensing factor MCM6